MALRPPAPEAGASTSSATSALLMVGVSGLEPETPWPQTRRASSCATHRRQRDVCRVRESLYLALLPQVRARLCVPTRGPLLLPGRQKNRGLLRPASPQVTGSCAPPYRCGSVYRRAGAAPRGSGGDDRARTCDLVPNQVRTSAPWRWLPHRGRALPTELRLHHDAGRGGGHRTHDLRIKSPLLLPAELHPGKVVGAGATRRARAARA